MPLHGAVIAMSLLPELISLVKSCNGMPWAATFVEKTSDIMFLAAQALQSGGAPKPGARVLIQGGPGGVGHFAVQLAKVHFKAYVVATGGPSNQAFMKVWCLGRTLSWEPPGKLLRMSCYKSMKKAVQQQA